MHCVLSVLHRGLDWAESKPDRLGNFVFYGYSSICEGQSGVHDCIHNLWTIKKKCPNDSGIVFCLDLFTTCQTNKFNSSDKVVTETSAPSSTSVVAESNFKFLKQWGMTSRELTSRSLFRALDNPLTSLSTVFAGTLLQQSHSSFEWCWQWDLRIVQYKWNIITGKTRCYSISWICFNVVNCLIVLTVYRAKFVFTTWP